MTPDHPTTRLNQRPQYVAGGKLASSIKSLLPPDGLSWELDTRGLQGYFRRRPDGTRTCVKGVRRIPGGCDVYATSSASQTQNQPRGAFAASHWTLRRRALPQENVSVLHALETSVATLLQEASNPVVALSGGLDSALVCALIQRITGETPACLSLAFDAPGYCEIHDTQAAAQTLGVERLEIVRVTVDDLIDALPAAIAACETPLFNLHPVSKLLLARAAKARGYDAIITGDGADQVFARADGRNYLPLIGAIVRSTGLSLLSPFFDERVVASARRVRLDRDKTELRRAAAAVLPAHLAYRKKRPRLAPDVSLAHLRGAPHEQRLAACLGQTPPDVSPGPEQTLWATACALLKFWEGNV